METDLKLYDVVDSTNDTLKELADKGAPEGTCVMAFCQKTGMAGAAGAFFRLTAEICT